MLRRAAAGLILGVSLFVASLAWSSFIALRTVFDPDRSQQIADDLWEDEAVRAQLASNIATGAAALVPDDVEVPQSTLDAAALQVLEAPVLRSVVNAAFVDTHRAFLGEGDLPRAIEIGEVSQTVRDALVTIDPSLDQALPAAPDVTIELPTDRIPDAGVVRRALQFVVPIFAVVAAVGIAVALLTTTNRPAVLRRAGTWAITSSAFVLVVAFGVPWLATRVVPTQAEVLAALVAAVLSAAITPSIVLAALGAAAIVLSFTWKATQVVRADDRRVGRSDKAERSTPRGGSSSVLHVPQGPVVAPTTPPTTPPAAAVPTVAAPPATDAGASEAGSSPAQVGPGVGQQQESRPPAGQAPGTGSAPLPSPEPVGAPAAAVPPEAARDGLAPRWVPGVGWVQHPDDERPPDAGARWEPGIGYIFDRPADPFTE